MKQRRDRYWLVPQCLEQLYALQQQAHAARAAHDAHAAHAAHAERLAIAAEGADEAGAADAAARLAAVARELREAGGAAVERQRAHEREWALARGETLWVRALANMASAHERASVRPFDSLWPRPVVWDGLLVRARPMYELEARVLQILEEPRPRWDQYGAGMWQRLLQRAVATKRLGTAAFQEWLFALLAVQAGAYQKTLLEEWQPRLFEALRAALGRLPEAPPPQYERVERALAHVGNPFVLLDPPARFVEARPVAAPSELAATHNLAPEHQALLEWLSWALDRPVQQLLGAWHEAEGARWAADHLLPRVRALVTTRQRQGLDRGYSWSSEWAMLDDRMRAMSYVLPTWDNSVHPLAEAAVLLQDEAVDARLEGASLASYLCARLTSWCVDAVAPAAPVAAGGDESPLPPIMHLERPTHNPNNTSEEPDAPDGQAVTLRQRMQRLLGARAPAAPEAHDPLMEGQINDALRPSSSTEAIMAQRATVDEEVVRAAEHMRRAATGVPQEGVLELACAHLLKEGRASLVATARKIELDSWRSGVRTADTGAHCARFAFEALVRMMRQVPLEWLEWEASRIHGPGAAPVARPSSSSGAYWAVALSRYGMLGRLWRKAPPASVQYAGLAKQVGSSVAAAPIMLDPEACERQAHHWRSKSAAQWATLANVAAARMEVEDSNRFSVAFALCCALREAPLDQELAARRRVLDLMCGVEAVEEAPVSERLEAWLADAVGTSATPDDAGTFWTAARADALCLVLGHEPARDPASAAPGAAPGAALGEVSGTGARLAWSLLHRARPAPVTA